MTGRSVALNPEQTAHCLNCETGCCTLFEVQATQEEAEAIMRLAVPGAPKKFEECFTPSTDRPGEFVMRKGSDGRCVFADGRLCAIHKRHGMAAKPLSCRIFPLHIQPWADGGLSAELRFICPSVGLPGGTPLGERTDEILRFARQLGLRRGVNDCIYSRANPAPLGKVRLVHAGFRQLLRNRELPLKLRLYAAARILDFHDRKEMFGAIQNADEEFADDLAAFVEKARPELERELGRGRCDALVRSEFRSLLCGYLRDDRPEDAALSRRLRRALSHLRVFSGVGALTELNPAAPPVSMLLFPAVGRVPEFSPEAVAVFEMFFFGKLDSMHFCGTKIQRFDYVTGLRHLLHSAPCAFAMAAAFAVARDRKRVEFADMHRAVRLLDFTFGRSPFFRMRLARKWIDNLARPRRFAGLLNQVFR